MKIAVINAGTQKEKNEILFQKSCEAAHGHTVINFGVFKEEALEFSYVQTALCVSLLLSSRAVDFAITGCSSGTGMMLACNSLPNVICGYINHPAEAYLFGRINDGNAISLPLGLNYGWAGEINLGYTLEKLFEEPFGTGYPPKDANRKQKDTKLLKRIKAISHVPLVDILNQLDKDIVAPIRFRKIFMEYMVENSRDRDITEYIKRLGQPDFETLHDKETP